MGKLEEPMIWYYEKENHFAELLNGWLFGGKNRLLPEQVKPVNIRYVGKEGKGRKSHYRSRYRDVVKRIEDIQIRIIIGTEIQSYVDYTMPVRIMDYDVVEYLAQIDRKRKEVSIDSRSLSALNKEDRLTPVLTLVLYLGEESWDAAENLHEMLDFSKVPEELHKYISDYSVHVLDVCHTPDERLMEFPNDIACMFLLLKYRKDKVKLEDLMNKTKEFQQVGQDMYDAVCNFVNEKQMLEIRDRLKNENGGVNMHQAIREMVEDGKMEGRIEERGRLNRLTLCLLDEERFMDLKKAAEDTGYQDELFREYGI